MKLRSPFSPLFRKYVISNLCLVLLPVLLLVTMIYLTMQRQYLDDQLLMQQNSVERVVQTMDGHIAEIKEISNIIALDPTLTHYQLSSGEYDAIESIKRLSLYTAQSSLSDSILLYRFGDTKLYTQLGVIDLDAFVNYTYRPNDGSGAEGLYALLNTTGEMIVPEGWALIKPNTYQPPPLSVIIYPWRQPGNVAIGSIVHLVQQSFFMDLAGQMLSALPSLSYIATADGRVIFSAANEWEADFAAVRPLLDGARDAETVSLGGQQASLVARQSGENGWIYASVVAQSNLLWNLFLLQGEALAGVYIALLVGLIGSVLLAYLYYRPIVRISTLFAGTEVIGRTGGDTLLQIQMRVQNMLSEKEEMLLQLRESRAYERQSFFRGILRGEVSGDDQIIEALRDHIEPGPYSVLAVHCPEEAGPGMRQQLVRGLSQESLEVVDSMYRTYLICVFSLGDAPLGERVEAVLAPAGALRGQLSVGVGNPRDTLRYINESYTEAVIALESTLDAPGVVGYAQWAERTAPERASSQSLLFLAQGLRQKDRSITQSAIHRIQGEMLSLQDEQDPVPLRYLCMRIVELLAELFGELNMPQARQQAMQLLYYGQPETFLSGLRSLCNQAHDSIAERERQRSRKLLEDILGYVDGHCFDNSFSLQAVAEHFCVSPSYLSRFFREHAGVNFIEYTGQRRMDRAEELLRTTEDSVRSVMQRVGYLDLSSFTRKFTQRFGMSPAKYRGHCRREV